MKVPLEKKVVPPAQVNSVSSVSAQHPDNPFKSDKKAVNPFLPATANDAQTNTVQMKPEEKVAPSAGSMSSGASFAPVAPAKKSNTSVQPVAEAEAKADKPAPSMAETMSAKLQNFDRRLNKTTDELRQYLMSQYKITDKNDPSIASAIKIHEAYIKDKNDGDSVGSTVADSIA